MDAETDDEIKRHIVLIIEDGEVLEVYVPNDGCTYTVHGKDFDHRTLEGAGDDDWNTEEYLKLQDVIGKNGLIPAMTPQEEKREDE